MGVLKDGVILCESINLLWPGSISEIIEKNSSIAFLENVNSFLTACEFVAGVPKEFLFEPQELISVKNPYKVLQTIHYLSSIVKEKGIKAPCIVDRFSFFLLFLFSFFHEDYILFSIFQLNFIF